MNTRRFPPPWTVERLPGGFKVIDANDERRNRCAGHSTALPGVKLEQTARGWGQSGGNSPFVASGAGSN